MVVCQMILDKMGLKGYQVHLDYLEAGADIILTTSYQATIQGFEAKGFSREESETFLRKSVEIACEAQTVYYERCAHNASSSNKDAWWYGAVGHLESCDQNEDHCHCQNSGSLLSQTSCGGICSYKYPTIILLLYANELKLEALLIVDFLKLLLRNLINGIAKFVSFIGKEWMTLDNVVGGAIVWPTNCMGIICRLWRLSFVSLLNIYS